MVFFMENRIYPDNIVIRLFEGRDEKKQHPKQFVLKNCIGTGANCVAYMAEGEDGIPVKLKHFRPAGVQKDGERYHLAEARFIQAYKQQLSMMKDERTAAVTSGLYGLYQDDTGFWWTSVSAMVGRTLDTILSENSLQKNIGIIRRVAESIKGYHEAGWILLDVKPENILVIDSLGLQGVNFFDFDSFIQHSEIQAAAKEGHMLVLSSSEGYSAPELLETEVDLREIGITVDFYSVGALLFSAVFSHRPELFDCLSDSEYDFSPYNDNYLSSRCRKAIENFFHHTLTMSSDGRFETDDEVLAALDEIIALLSSSAPQLSTGMPHAVSTFYGRESEIEAIVSAVRESSSPLYLSGIGGIGKTQLILKVAEELREEFDFYYIPFKNSVRETILSVPMEYLPTEGLNENGLPVSIPGEEQYQIILSALRKGYDQNSVLIIDNFDTPNDEDTPALRYDPDFADLETLPVRLLFTTRCRFEGVRTIVIDNLGEAAIVQMLSDGFPEGDKNGLLQLANAVGRHTLTISILTGTAKESKGKLKVKDLLEELSGEIKADSVISQLGKVFMASKMSKTARSVMACACLFPQRGISSDILVRLFSPGQWISASQLERSGWLRFDQYSCLWTIHPIIRAVCMAEKTTQIDWNNVGCFITQLQNAHQQGYFEEISAEGRAQLNELFSNVGKYSLTKPFPWRKVVPAVFVAIVLILLPFLTKYKRDDSPLLSLQLVPGAESSAEDIIHDSVIIPERFKQLGFNQLSVDESTGIITGKIRLSKLGRMSNIEDSLRAMVKYPGSFFVIGSGKTQWKYEEVNREHILFASVKTGSVSGLSDSQREDLGLSVTADYPYLYLQFDEEGEEILEEFTDKIRDMFSFAFDFDQYGNDLQFAYAFPGEEENSYCLIGNRGVMKRYITRLLTA